MTREFSRVDLIEETISLRGMFQNEDSSEIIEKDLSLLAKTGLSEEDIIKAIVSIHPDEVCGT